MLRNPHILPLFATLSFAATAHAQTLLAEWHGGPHEKMFGDVVKSIGDMNQDGVEDYVIAAEAATGPAGQANMGKVIVRSGATHQNLAVLWGDFAGDRFGTSVAGAGDVNGDGWRDLIVGAPNSSVNAFSAGAAYVYSGQTWTRLYTKLGTNDLDYVGLNVAGGGDYNADGKSDFVIQTWQHAKVTVYSGNGGTPLAIFTADGWNHSYGNALSFVGDVNQDGHDDLAIGTPFFAWSSSASDFGRFEVRSGKTSSVLFMSTSALTKSKLGFSIAPAGDVNGDGKPDVIVGSPGENADTGRATVYFGPSGIAGPTFTGASALDHFGASVSAAGDVDGDGKDDVVVGANRQGATFGGSAYVKVFSGANGALMWSPIDPAEVEYGFGSTIAHVGDLDGDGWQEILVGSWAESDAVSNTFGGVRHYELNVHQPNLGGGNGTAKLEMFGTPLYENGHADLRLDTDVAFQPTWLLASLSALNLPFLGGTLAPNFPSGVVLTGFTNSQGDALIPGVIGGYGYIDVYVQYVIHDAQMTGGYQLSNAILVQFQP